MKLKSLKIKYTAIDKETYDTDKSGLDFEVKINGIKARGRWFPTHVYTSKGVDINELCLYEDKYNRFNIFEGGGGRRYYEMHGIPEKKAKQPKNLAFTGEYYSALNLGNIFKDKINEALNGKNPNTKLSKEFLKVFKIIE